MQDKDYKQKIKTIQSPSQSIQLKKDQKIQLSAIEQGNESIKKNVEVKTKKTKKRVGNAIYKEWLYHRVSRDTKTKKNLAQTEGQLDRRIKRPHPLLFLKERLHDLKDHLGIFALLGGVITPIIVMFLTMSLFLTNFIGFTSSKEGYEEIFSAVQSQYSSDIQKLIQENDEGSIVHKESLPNISEGDYQTILEDQIQQGSTSVVGNSKIDFKAQLAIIQVLTGGKDASDETARTDVLGLLQYWDQQGVIEKHHLQDTDVESEINYLSTINLPVQLTTTSSSEEDALQQLKKRVKDIIKEVEDSYESIDQENLSLHVVSRSAFTTELFDVVEDEDAPIEEGEETEKTNPFVEELSFDLSLEEEEEGFVAYTTGSIQVQKHEVESQKHTMQTIVVENGTLDDYLQATQEGLKNNATVMIDDSLSFGSSQTTYENKNGLSEGDTLDIPAGEQCYSYTCYDYWYQSGTPMVWSSGTNQRIVADRWKQSGAEFNNGIAVIDGRYLIATTTTLGTVGDFLDVELENGTVLPCIIADIKSQSDAEWTEFGHQKGDQLNVIEFEVQRDKAVKTKTNPGTPGWLPSWDSNVVRVANLGKKGLQEAKEVKASEHSKNFGKEVSLRSILNREDGQEGISESEIEQIKQLYQSETFMEEFDFGQNAFALGDYGFQGSIKKAMLGPESKQWFSFAVSELVQFDQKGNPFGQVRLGATPWCTWWAWARFKMIYDIDAGTHGNGCTNVDELLLAHPKEFKESSTPAPGAMFSIPPGVLSGPASYAGHVGVVEKIDDHYIWTSEGGFMGSGSLTVGLKKWTYEEFFSTYPGVHFAIPKGEIAEKVKKLD